MQYCNPLWPHYLADPFVVRVGKGYWAYGTAPAAEDGKQFAVLKSSDLVNWSYAGHALQPLRDPPGVNYWAPEVAAGEDGRFYLYYSATTSQSDEHHRLRVAVADDPAGPFIDSGKLLIPDAGFTIDASPFRDPRSGKWFLYFASDYTEDAPHGTGLSVVPLADDMLHVAGAPRMALRARSPWQIYERNRDYKGRVWEAWYCVEGPSVLFHGDRYYCLYSGGAWHSDNYGVGFAVADDPLGPWCDEMAERGPTVLRGAPPKVIGPGHCSIVPGPEDRGLWCMYHAWDEARTARRMFMDPLIWTPTGPRVDGPSITPRTV
jgi:beta-xylosidase